MAGFQGLHALCRRVQRETWSICNARRLEWKNFCGFYRQCFHHVANQTRCGGARLNSQRCRTVTSPALSLASLRHRCNMHFTCCRLPHGNAVTCSSNDCMSTQNLQPHASYSSQGKSGVDVPVPSAGIGSTTRRLPEPEDGPSLSFFLASSSQPDANVESRLFHDDLDGERIPYVPSHIIKGAQRKVFFETYGCQMNVNDTEIAWSILKDSGFSRAANIHEADVVLAMTCSIREGAETKIWKRLEFYKSLKRKRQRMKGFPPLKIGVLGCMAERLKDKIVEQEKMVDLVCGPDAYRDLPLMLALTAADQTAVNTILSLDETYANVMPVRLNTDSPSAFVSIMRGCDNMCTYCIVPFTRGRERSRPIGSIVEEIRILSSQGVKEVTLLGQNVNSYRDLSESPVFGGVALDSPTKLSAGFRTVYRSKTGGRRFSDLLEKVSAVDPEMRIRFTSPHPKDFPDEVLYLIRERANICKQLHLPAQSGNDAVLEAMRRGYTRHAYLDLVEHVRSIIPDVALSSDFIAGFCGETEEAHRDTVSLMKQVKYNFAFCFPYSMRQKTRAHHRLEDDVPADVKSHRHMELIAVFREEAEKLNMAQVGQQHLVLVEGESKRSDTDLSGRNAANTKVIFPKMEIPVGCQSREQREIQSGDYVAVQILSGNSQVLKGVPLYHTTLQEFYAGCQQDAPLMEGAHLEL